MANQERTFIMIKPDGVQRGLVGKIIQRFEEKGFKLVAIKMTSVSVREMRYAAICHKTNMCLWHYCSSIALLKIIFANFLLYFF